MVEQKPATGSERTLYRNAVREDQGIFVESLRAHVQKEVERALSKRPEGSRDGPDWRSFTTEEMQCIAWGDLCGIIPVGLSARGLLLVKIKQQAVEKAMRELKDSLEKEIVSKFNSRELYIDGLAFSIRYIDARWPNAKKVKP
jgi:hypothetical protein